MKTVELKKGIHSSVIGFGCAPMLGAVDAKTARYALDYALDHGVNHLDLARSYGFGEAEGFIGKITQGKRDQVVLASKFGIKPNWKASLLNSAKPLIRIARNLKNGNKPAPKSPPPAPSGAIGSHFLDRIVPLRGKDMRNSLEKSLTELRSDHLDYFFIHEPLHQLNYIDELKETAELLKTEGKIKAWGLAYMHSQKHLHESYVNSFDLLQFNKPEETEDYNKLVVDKGNDANIIFSAIRGGSADMTPAEKLRKLLIDFPNSVILCSMFNLEHLKQNIKIVESH